MLMEWWVDWEMSLTLVKRSVMVYHIGCGGEKESSGYNRMRGYKEENSHTAGSSGMGDGLMSGFQQLDELCGLFIQYICRCEMRVL